MQRFSCAHCTQKNSMHVIAVTIDEDANVARSSHAGQKHGRFIQNNGTITQNTKPGNTVKQLQNSMHVISEQDMPIIACQERRSSEQDRKV
jgi:hypothetical protein